MKISCCFECTERTPECHGKCEKYLEESKMRAAEREAIHKEKQKLGNYLEFRQDGRSHRKRFKSRFTKCHKK